MENVVIVAALLMVLILGLRHGKKHFSGGGCCGSGSNTIRTKKTLTEPEIGRMVLRVEGMHCENCQARVENALNRLDGVACLVDLRKKTATVRYSRPVAAEELCQTLEKLGYSATPIS